MDLSYVCECICAFKSVEDKSIGSGFDFTHYDSGNRVFRVIRYLHKSNV